MTFLQLSYSVRLPKIMKVGWQCVKVMSEHKVDPFYWELRHSAVDEIHSLCSCSVNAPRCFQPSVVQRNDADVAEFCCRTRSLFATAAPFHRFRVLWCRSLYIAFLFICRPDFVNACVLLPTGKLLYKSFFVVNVHEHRSFPAAREGTKCGRKHFFVNDWPEFHEMLTICDCKCRYFVPSPIIMLSTVHKLTKSY